MNGIRFSASWSFVLIADALASVIMEVLEFTLFA